VCDYNIVTILYFKKNIMELEIDTKNWFKDKYFTTLIIVAILMIVNIILSCVILSRQCNMHNMGMQNQWVVHTMMIRK
jgi:hypothetical protein